MNICTVCDGTGSLLDMPCPLCDNDADTVSSSAVHLSLEDLQRMRSASSPEARARIFRELALRCHPDKFAEEMNKVEATRTFQKLMMAREESQRVPKAAVAEVSTDKEGRPPVCTLKQGDVVHGVAFSPSGERVASCGDSGRLCIWRAVSHDWRLSCLHTRIDLESDTALAVAFLAEMQLAVAIGECIEVWSLEDVARTFTETLESRVRSLVASNVCAYLAAGTELGLVKVWLWCQEQRKLHIVGVLDNKFAVNEMAWAVSGRMLAVAGGSQVSLWYEGDADWNLLASLRIAVDLCEFFCVDVVDSLCAVGGASGIVAVWSLHDTPGGLANSPAERDVDSNECCSIASMTDSNASLVESSQPTDAVHADGGPLIFVAMHATDERFAVNSVSLTSDGRFLVSGGADCRLLLWCLYSQAVVGVFSHRLPPGGCCLCTATVNAVCVSPNCMTMLVGGYDGVVTMWSIPQCKPITT